MAKNKRLNVDLTQYPDGFELICCEICGQTDAELIVQRKDVFLGGDQLFQMVKCCHCGTYYQNPRPSQQVIHTYYPDEYPVYLRDQSNQNRIKLYLSSMGYKKRYDLIRKYKSSGRILDIGCATGQFIQYVQEQGDWQVEGIEISETASRYAREQLGLQVQTGILDTAELPNAQYDVITMWDVLEHVPDPKKTIARVAQLLAPNGIFVINCPNLASMDKVIFSGQWLGYEIPRHFTLFPIDVLQQLGHSFGIPVVFHRSIYGNYSSTASQIAFWAGEKFQSNTVTKRVERFVKSNGMRFLFYPLFKGIERMNWGSNATTVFQKSQNSL